MKLYSVFDQEFKRYGALLEGYDYTKLFETLGKVENPDEKIVYVASDKALEENDEAKRMEIRGFGAYPVQLGYVTAKNRTMNCLEYHKSSEYNISMNDVVLVVGCQSEIQNSMFDSSLCKAFLLPAGVGVELYATTLHYAPLDVEGNGYRVICVLPRGTNGPKVDFETQNSQDKMCFGVNKWLMAHETAPEVKDGAFVGIVGENITLDMIGD